MTWLSLSPADEPGCFLCGLRSLQCDLVNTILGGVETEGGRAGLQVGDARLTWGGCGGAATPVQGQSGAEAWHSTRQLRRILLCGGRTLVRGGGGGGGGGEESLGFVRQHQRSEWAQGG